MIYLPDSLNVIPKGSAINLIKKLLIAHIIILFLMIPIRSIFFDVTIYRDFFLFSVLFVLLGIHSLNKNFQRRSNVIDKLVFCYLSIGIIISLFYVVSGDLDFLSAIREYRNHFLPFMLFFATRLVIADYKSRIAISNFLFFLLIIFTFSILCEYILIELIGISPFNIHWYKYMFTYSDRYIGNAIGSMGYIDPNNTPVLGVFGWAHSSAAVLMCLLAFNYPFMISNDEDHSMRNLLIYRVPQNFNYFIIFIIGFILLVVFLVKMHILTYALLLILFPSIISKTNILKGVLFSLIIAVVVMNLESIKYLVIDSIIKGFIGDNANQSTLLTILEIDFSKIFSSITPKSFLLGNYYMTAGGEFRILDYTLRFGIIWLTIFLGFIFVVYTRLRRCIVDNKLFFSDKIYINGIIYLLLICYIDMGHYARAMTWPMIDLMAMGLGSLSPFFNYVNKKNFN